MRKFIAFSALLIAAALSFAPAAQAQSAQVPVIIKYTLPATAVPPGNEPLTGALAITKVQFWVSTSTIPANTTAAPSLEVPVGTLTASVPITAAVGSTVYARMKACTQFSCSDLTNEGTGVVTVPKPGAPSIVSITITVTP